MNTIRCMASFLAALLSCAVTPAALAEDITYHVDHVYLSDGYAIEGGFITTNGIGNIGLSEGEVQIVDYEVVVTGPWPYVFRPNNPGAEVDWLFVEATKSSLIAKRGVDSHGPFGFSANDFHIYPDPCQRCSLQVEWFVPLFSPDSPELRAPAEISYSLTTPLGVRTGAWSDGGELRLDAPFITVARVPEPSPFALALCGLLGLLSLQRR